MEKHKCSYYDLVFTRTQTTMNSKSYLKKILIPKNKKNTEMKFTKISILVIGLVLKSLTILI